MYALCSGTADYRGDFLNPKADAPGFIDRVGRTLSTAFFSMDDTFSHLTPLVWSRHAGTWHQRHCLEPLLPKKIVTIIFNASKKPD